MILEMTFHDNDYTQHIESFLDNKHMDPELMGFALLEPYKDDSDESLEKYVKISQNTNKILDSLYHNDKPSKEQKEAFINFIKECFIISFRDINKDSLDYMREHLEIKEVDSVKSKWQNDEVVYWFVDYHKYITM